MRIMDQLNRLHVITISGGYIGSDRDCEVVVSNQLLPERCAEIVYSEEAACYSIEKLETACILQVNGNTVQVVTFFLGENMLKWGVNMLTGKIAPMGEWKSRKKLASAKTQLASAKSQLASAKSLLASEKSTMNR